MPTATATEKVNPAAASDKEIPADERPAKVSYIETVAAPNGLVDTAGRLTSHEAPGFDPKVHKSLKKGDFDAEHNYMRHRADFLEAKAADYIEQAAKMREQATVLESQPDPTKRKAIKRMQRLRDQLAELEAQLKEEGLA